MKKLTDLNCRMARKIQIIISLSSHVSFSPSRLFRVETFLRFFSMFKNYLIAL